MPTIVIVRHGETDANRAMILQGEESRLSVLGHKQAELVASRLAGMFKKAKKIISSDLPRTIQTTEKIIAAYNVPLDSVHQTPLLRERRFGKYLGYSYQSIREGGIDLFHPDFEPEGGESWRAFHERVEEAWDYVMGHSKGLNKQDVVIVITHGLVCYSIATRLWNVEVKGLAFGNTSVSIVEIDEEENTKNVTLLNCVEHLANL